MKKHRGKPKKPKKSPLTAAASQKTAPILAFPSGRRIRVGELGVFDRSYPPKRERDHAIAAIRALPDDQRSPDQWWMLGEYLIYGGLIDENDAEVNDGIACLMRGATLPQPSVACMMDLAWILAFKGLDAMALPHIERAAALVPDSRDVLSMKAYIQMGLGDSAGAISSYEQAVRLPHATDIDRNILAKLKEGSDPRALRKTTVFRKVGLDDPDLAAHPSGEQARAAVLVAKQIYDLDPTDLKAAEALAFARYCAGQFDRAKPLLLSIVGTNPANASMWTLLGLIAKKTGNPDGELEMYARALQADPDYVLALVNTASRVQDRDPYAARPMLDRVLQISGPENPHFHVALDLMGNNLGMTEADFAREAEFHRRAIKLAPNNGGYRGNLILSLLSAGRFIDARREWQAGKHLISASNYPFPLGDVVQACCDEGLHPYELLQLADTLDPVVGKLGLGMLVERAWKRRSLGPPEERLAFLQDLGLFATRFDRDELALQVWREASRLDPTDAARVNEAVALDRLGRTSEALELIESLSPAGDRFYTCLGNIRWNAGLLKAAVEAYATAVESEPRFELPFTNAFACIEHLRDPSLVAPFVKALQDKWPAGPVRDLLTARANLLAGRPGSAATLFEKVIIQDGEIISPEALHLVLHDETDQTLMVQPSAEYHLAYAEALLSCRRLDQVHKLVAAVFLMPRWANGDWKIINGEIARLSGRGEDLNDLLQGMDDQIPAQISKALVAIERDDAEAASALIRPALEHPSAGGFRHPEGRPDALARAMASAVSRHAGDLKAAVELGREAVVRDPGCVLARAVLVNALLDTNDHADVVNVLSDGLRRLPSEPRMLRLAVETFVSLGMTAEADDALSRDRAGLEEYGSADLGFRLGELVAAAKLASSSPSERDKKAAEEEWPWIVTLNDPIRRWLVGAHRSASNMADLRIAMAMFVGKVAEKLIVDRVLVPFRKAQANPSLLADDHFLDISKFLEGGRPPSIGGFVRLLRAAMRPFRSSDPRLVVEFRSFLRRATWPGAPRLMTPQFVDGLGDLAGVRNDSAHLEEPTERDILSACSLVVADGKPGVLFEATGLTLNGKIAPGS